MIRQSTSAVAVILAAFALPVSAEALRLAAPAVGDLIPGVLETPKVAAVEQHRVRELIQFSWPIEETSALDFSPEPFIAESREFWTTLEPAELAKGFPFTTTAPGALIRLSPAGEGKHRGLDLSGLRVEIAGRSFSPDQAFAVIAHGTELKQAGAEFPEGTVAFRLRPEIGYGPTRLFLPKAAGRVLVHVFEPDSPVVLRLQATPFVGADGVLRLAGEWAGLAKSARPGPIAGLLTAPDGQSQTFEIERPGTRFDTAIALGKPHSAGEGLWEVHLFAGAASPSGDLRRDVRTAFSVSVPSARLAGRAERREDKDALIFILAVDAALPARYEVRATITGTAADGNERPLAVAHAAAWLEAGEGAIPLRVEKSHLTRAGIGAPFALRDLRLIRQGDHNLQERRDRALEWR